MQQAVKLKAELEEGMRRWGEQVLEVQDHNIRRAERQVEEEQKRRRDKEAINHSVILSYFSCFIP